MTPRAQLVQAITEARAQTDSLFAMLRPDSFYERPIPERHRLIFYLGHLEAFDWNQLSRDGLGLTPFHPSFDQLFAFGIDPPVGQLPDDQASDWPSVEEVRDYNRQARQKLDRVLGEAPDQMLHVALEHRLMHAETFAYLLHNLAPERKAGQDTVANGSSPVPTPRMIEIPEGTATLGRARAEGFGWDNEYDRRTEPVPSFAIAKHKVTNGQYLEFVKAGGSAPHFWTRRNDHWRWRTMFGEIPLPLDWPVYVTWMQALEYTQWKEQALPTEAQFHRAAFGTPAGGERLYPWGDEPPDARRGNFDFHRWDPVPVSATPAGDSAFGVSQLLGNGWEWTSTVFRPFDGFEPFPFYPGYSAPFFDGAHYVLKGASPRTAARLLRRSYRNWFRPNYPYVYATFRCVEH